MPKNERYNRNILISQIGEHGQEKLQESKVLVMGAGGLGSTVIANLAAVGAGNIGIVDCDKLEITNLNRQFIHKNKNIGKIKVESAKEWVKDFNPEVNIETFDIKLDSNNYKRVIKNYDLIIDCFDSYNSKFLLNKIAVENEKTLIHGGVAEFYGQVTTIIPHKTACLECILPNSGTENYNIKGVISPVVSTIASIQALEAVKNILNIGETLENKLLSFNFLSMSFKKLHLEKNLRCKLCSNK